MRGWEVARLALVLVLGVVMGANFAFMMLQDGSPACTAGHMVSSASPTPTAGDAGSVVTADRQLKSDDGRLGVAFTPGITGKMVDKDDHGCRYGDDAVQFKGERGEPLYHQFCRGNVAPTSADEVRLADLKAVLEKVAINREILVAVSDYNLILQGMLTTFIECVQRAGVKNFLIVALDDKLGDHLAKLGVPYYRRDAVASDKQKNLGANHRISGLKFQVLKDFLLLGYSVLLSDVDIVTLNDPFQRLYRDADVESLSDGFNDHTVFGYDDVFDDPNMGWSRYAHTFRIFVYNSGLFYIRATYTSIELVDRVVGWLEAESAWDQAVFNLVIWKPSHNEYIGLNPTTRVMDPFVFMNSKTFFTIVRHNPSLLAEAAKKMSMIHVNYHPDKYPRMLALVDYYVHGKKDAITIDKFPDGSETPERLKQIREDEEKRRGQRRLLSASGVNATDEHSWTPPRDSRPDSPFYA